MNGTLREKSADWTSAVILMIMIIITEFYQKIYLNLGIIYQGGWFGP